MNQKFNLKFKDKFIEGNPMDDKNNMEICEDQNVTSYAIKNMLSIYVNQKISTIAKAGIQNKQYTS